MTLKMTERHSLTMTMSDCHFGCEFGHLTNVMAIVGKDEAMTVKVTVTITMTLTMTNEFQNDFEDD